MPGPISLAILFIVIILKQGPVFAMKLSVGDWGNAVSDLLAPIALFYIIQSVLYFGIRLLGGLRDRTFNTARTNYVSLAVTLFSLASQWAARS